MKNEVNDLDVDNKKTWYSFSKRKGIFLLGTVAAIVAYGSYVKQPTVEMNVDTFGVSSYVECASSLIAKDVNEKNCRFYFETYLQERIARTGNLPKIVPESAIKTTYEATQLAFKDKGFEPLPLLAIITKDNIL